MQIPRRVNTTHSARDGYQGRKTCQLWMSTVFRTLSSLPWVSCLFISVIVCVLLGADVQSVTADSRRKNRAVSQLPARSQSLTSAAATHTATLVQPPQAHRFINQPFHLLLEPLPTASPMTTAAQPPSPFSVAYTRFAIFPEVRGDEDSPFTVSGIISAPELDIANAAEMDMSVAMLSALPLLAWVNYRSSNALQFHVSQFGTPTELMPLAPLAPLPLAFARARLLSPSLTVAEVHGVLTLGATDNGVLQYALYTGVFSEKTPRDLIAGARIGYTVGTAGFTLGIGYLYGPQAVGLEVVDLPYAGGAVPFPDSGFRRFVLHLLPDRDKRLIENQLLHGVATREQTPLAVQAKPTFHINNRWTVFYRFKHLRFGQGLPKITEHAFGVKFFPVANLSLHAECMVERADSPAVEAGGFRLSGTIHF